MGFHLGDDEQEGMSEINLIPLIDIMLVLMIIFLVTATIVNPAVKLNLPKADSQVIQDPPEVVTLSIDAQGVIHWNQDVVTMLLHIKRPSPLSICVQIVKRNTIRWHKCSRVRAKRD
jgi:biopolymer transport protein ExbD